jgi:internalin A
MWQLSAVTRPNLVRLGLESICGITDLQPLSACTGLVSINISAYKGTNINPLASSANTMTTLFLWKCPKLTNIVALRLFSNLVTLDLHKNELLEDISPVSVGCSHSLKKLDLSNCSKLSNIYPLSLCTALTSLDLSFCSAIDTISPLCPCKGMAYLSLHQLKLLPPYSLVYLINMWDLKILDVGGINDIHISYLSSCKNLIHLLMRSCLDVHDISGVVNCTKLETLIIRSHILEDISPLASCTSLTRLCLLNTSVSDISPLASCTNLKKLEGLHPNVIKEWKKQQKAIAGTL